MVWVANSCWSFKGSAITITDDKTSSHETEQKISGTYTERGGGVIQGIVSGSRLDFTWKDKQAEGWGFFRAIFSQGTITGLWGYDTDKTDIHSLIGIRQYSALPTNLKLYAEDAREIKYLAQNLWQQGRGELAVPLLEKVRIFYESERLQLQTQKTDINFLIEELEVLKLLIRCEAQSNNFEPLPERLRMALEIVQLQDPKRLLKQNFNHQIDEFTQILNETTERLQIVESNLDQPQTTSQERIEVVEAFNQVKKECESLQNKLNHDCSELNNLKIRFNINKTDDESINCLDVDNLIVQSRDFFLSEIDQVAARQRIFFQDEIELINDFNIWLQASNYENITNASIDDLNKLDRIEDQIKQSVKNNIKLTKIGKKLFIGQFLLVAILLMMTNGMEILRMTIRSNTTQMEERFPLTGRVKSYDDSLNNLSAHMESWRKELATDIDKIEALGKGQEFFQQLVRILFELGSYKRALVISEKAKTRAFADLLATPSNIQEGIRQIFSQERVIFNIATTDSLTFEDILELVKHQ